MSNDPLLNNSKTSFIFHHIISGFWILFVTSLSSFALKFVNEIKSYLLSYAWTSLDINNQEQPYEWVMSYLESILHEEERKNVKINLKVDNVDKLRLNYVNYKNSGEIIVDDTVEDIIGKELGEGNHKINFQGSKLHVQVSASDKLSTRGWYNEPFQMKTITITAYGVSKEAEKILNNFVSTARKYFIDKKFEEKAKIYLVSKWGSWMQSERKKEKRYIDSVILDRQLSEFILNDVKNFLSDKKWYRDHGIPYRRGYCLYGPPGNGKSSFVVALASELSLNICVLTLSASNMDDNTMQELLTDAPYNSIILLEDIDSIFVNREATQDMKSNRVTFSGLLNALDGVVAQEDKLIFMTTNHLDKLDPALLRPGRCDVKIRFGNASKIQIRNMFLRFNPNCDELLTKKFVDSIPDESVSCSTLQEHFLKYGDPESAVKNVSEVLKDPKREREDLDHFSTFSISNGLEKWLTRLGLSHYTETFHKSGYYKIEDLNDPTDALYNLHSDIPLGHCSRIENMIKGDPITISYFQYASSSTIYSIMTQFYGSEISSEFIDKTSNLVTSFQLMEHFSKYNPNDAIAKIDELLNPPLTWNMSYEEKKSIFDIKYLAKSFIESLTFSNDIKEKLVETIEKEQIITLEELCETDISSLNLPFLKKGDIILLELAINKEKDKLEKLNSAIDNSKLENN